MKEKILEWGDDFGYEIAEIWNNNATYSISVKGMSIGMTALRWLERIGFRVLSIDIPVYLDVKNPTLDIWIIKEEKGE